MPYDPSSLVRWRQRIGEARVEELLTQTIEVAKGSGTIKAKSLDTVVVDTTVQEKAIAYLTDSRLLNTACEYLVSEARQAGIPLHQTYARVSEAAQRQAGQYAHAQQYKRICREVKKLRTWLGRVVRDVERKAAASAESLQHKLTLAKRFHAQQRNAKNKLYALHAPEVELYCQG